LTTDKTNNGGSGSGDVLPVYIPVQINDPSVSICSTNEFESARSGLWNKLATRRFLRFDVATSGNVIVTASANLIPPGEYADPDFVIHQSDPVFQSDDLPSASCQALASPGWQPSDCAQSATVALGVGSYVLEVYEFTNTLDSSVAPGPIGRTCFDVSVTQ
jgi:hypothetical protein